jgi:serine/threonine protein kinase/tetratricopeptide (TPR) repeat protein
VADDLMIAHTKTLEAPVVKLERGTTFAGRYEVIEFLGSGGMGKVYRVEDTKTKEELALKLLKPGIASDRRTIERFSNELKIAHKISHRNVCRMYHLGEEGVSYYITMEYVPGEDLRSFIRRSERLSIGKAINIAKQVCEGLAEAHGFGIVHRDLKPSNIMIDREGNVRIMDFGIARSLREKGITGAGSMIGTPEYMSPEQVDGKDVDLRSDIYSLGVVLYEMATGRAPFEGDTPISVAHKHKYEAVQDPKEVNAQIPDGLNSLILKCLEKDKGDRYQSVGELQSELENIEKSVPKTARTITEKKPSASREITVKFSLAKILIPVMILLAIGVTYFLFFMSQGPQLDPNRVVVAVFENRTGKPDLDHLGRMVHDWVTQGLQQIGTISVASRVPDEGEEKRKETDFIRWISSKSGAGKVITGTYYLQGDALQFHASVHDAREEKLLHVLEPVNSSSEDPMKAIELMRQKVMGSLATLFDEKTGAWVIGMKLPSYNAYKEYILGFDYFLHWDIERAIEHCSRAYELDPDFKLPLMIMAHSYINSGNYAEAEPIIKKIYQSLNSLPPIMRHVADYTKAELYHKWMDAYESASQAKELDVSHAFSYAYYAVCINRPEEAIEVLKGIDPEEGPTKIWAPYWSCLTTAYHMTGDHKQELKAARRGRKQFPNELGMFRNEVIALAAMGASKEINRLIEESFQPGFDSGLIMLRAGEYLRLHGHKSASLDVLNRAIEWYNNLPQEELNRSSTRYDLARVYYAADMWEEAKALFEALYGEFPESVYVVGYFGSTLGRIRDKEGAFKISQQLADLKKPYLFGSHTLWRSRIAATLGEKEGAVNLLREALSQGVSFYGLHWVLDFELLSDYPPYKELMKPKG